MDVSEVQKMLDNAATASQDRGLLEPVTRGAVLRSIAQWIAQSDHFEPATHGWIISELSQDPHYFD